jgi:hypothetical protein
MACVRCVQGGIMMPATSVGSVHSIAKSVSTMQLHSCCYVQVVYHMPLFPQGHVLPNHLSTPYPNS